MNIVKKFGGAFLSGHVSLNSIVSNVKSDYLKGDSQIIVTAAKHSFSGFLTTEFSELAPGYTRKDLDKIFCQAEYSTACMLADMLRENSVPARVIKDIRGYGLNDVDRYFGKRELILDEIQAVLDKGEIPVIPGYQGIGEFSTEDIQGRYGAAATAAALAGAMGWDCVLYGNVDGIYTMKPKDGGRLIRKISYEEAMELTALVKSDLESRAIEIAQAMNVKLYIGRDLTGDIEEGTIIMNRNLIVQEGAVTGIAVADNIAIFTLEDIPFDGDLISELFEVLADMGVDVDAISQQTAADGRTSVFFSADSAKADAIITAKEQNPRMKPLSMTVRDNISLVSLVGAGMVSRPGIAAQTFRCLAENGVHHYNITTSEITISAAVDMADRANAVIALSQCFDL